MNEIIPNNIKNVRPEIEQHQTKENLKKLMWTEEAYWKNPGNLPQEFIDQCKENDNSVKFELAVYFGYKDAEKAVNEDFLTERNNTGKVDAKEKRDRIYAKHFLMAQTEKFWVNIERRDDWGIKRNDSFLKRQNYRDNYFEQLNNDKEKLKGFIEASRKWEDITKYLPETDRNWIKRNERK